MKNLLTEPSVLLAPSLAVPLTAMFLRIVDSKCGISLEVRMPIPGASEPLVIRLQKETVQPQAELVVKHGLSKGDTSSDP